MMFYTNVEISGDLLYVRGVSDGKRFARKVRYKPTIYIPSPEGRFRTLTNKRAAPMQFASIKECRQFVDQYKDCLLYTSPSPRDGLLSRMPSSA